MSQTMSPLRTPPPLNKRPKRELPWPLNIVHSAVGRKWVMAITGIGMMGFVFTHMLGNLHLYQGPVKTHEYAETLRNLGVDVIPRTWLLWLLRLTLLAMLGFHLWAAWSLQNMGRKANPKSNLIDSNKQYVGGQDYATDTATSFAARAMRWTGPIILLFIVYHLIDITWAWFGWFDGFEKGQPYNNVVQSFSILPVAIFYIIANLALAVHLFHGVWSLFQSLGASNEKYNKARRGIAAGFAGIVLLGNLSFPILATVGVIDCDTDCIVEEVHEEEEAVR